MSDEQRKLTGEQIAIMTIVSAAALGLQIWRAAKQTPEHKRAESERLRAHVEARRRHDLRMRRAWNLDREHWRSFKEDDAAQTEFQRDYNVPVAGEPCTGDVSTDSGGSMWATWQSYRVSGPDGQLLLIHHHDGNRFGVKLSCDLGEYSCEGGIGPDQLYIGICDERASPIQQRIAGLIGVLQQAGHLTGKQVFVRKDYWKLCFAHYARYATARGWPPEKDGEATRASLDAPL